ncbi:MAG: NAD+ synthase [Candidatus Aenigmarchaeota archaeon]
MEDIQKKIEEWIRSKVKEAGAKGVVIGMSGGVDSSVVAVLAKHSLGKKALGLILPCDSCPGDAFRAGLVAEEFGVRTEEVNLNKVFGSLRKTFPKADRKALGNLKARLRMLVLYHFANKNGYLVLGTSNKSELRIGYITKYGDSGVDLEPLGDLYKTQVIGLAKRLGIPEKILEAKPTAGLWKGQTDSEEIGVGYDRLDQILEAIEKNETGKFDPKVYEKVKKMISRSGHKRRMPEVCKMS